MTGRNLKPYLSYPFVVGSTMSIGVVDGSGSALLSPAESVERSEDLMIEILIRIPPKPLIRLKCVSKRWLSLISDPYFCRRHTLHHPTTRVSGIFLPKRDFRDFEFAPISGRGKYHSAPPFKSLVDPDGDDLKILQSCNGLLLCSTPSPPKYYSVPTPRNRTYFMFNPTTKRFKVLPHPSRGLGLGLTIDDNVDMDLELALAFDPSRSPNYTVVCVRRIFHSSYHIMVYSSESEAEAEEAERGSAWKRCGPKFVAPDPGNMDIFESGVYWNGAVHWICSKRGVSLCFDLSQECLKNNNYMPPLPHGYFVAAAACDHLHLVECGRSRNPRVFRLERDYSKWVIMYNVDFTQLGAAFREMLGSFRPRSLVRNYTVLSLVQDDDSEEDLSLLLQIPGRKLVALRLKDNTLYKICDSGPRNIHAFHAYHYIESLACV